MFGSFSSSYEQALRDWFVFLQKFLGFQTVIGSKNSDKHLKAQYDPSTLDARIFGTG